MQTLDRPNGYDYSMYEVLVLCNKLFGCSCPLALMQFLEYRKDVQGSCLQIWSVSTTIYVVDGVIELKSTYYSYY